jgi:RimJ/RimL family protein N-acetyltransferase
MFSDGVVTLAPLERDDLPRVLTWVNDAELCRAVVRVLPVTQLEHERWYEALILRKDAVTFAIRHQGTLIGVCGLKDIHPRDRHAELWIYLGEGQHRGRGLGRRALKLLTRFGFDQLNLHRIHLHVPAYNAAAQRAYRACGFREEGRDREHLYIDGAYHDAVRMGLLRTELDLPPDAH